MAKVRVGHGILLPTAAARARDEHGDGGFVGHESIRVGDDVTELHLAALGRGHRLIGHNALGIDTRRPASRQGHQVYRSGHQLGIAKGLVVGKHRQGRRSARGHLAEVGVGKGPLASATTGGHIIVPHPEVLEAKTVHVLAAAPGGQGCGHQLELAGMFDVPTHEHGRVLVGRVVTVLHVGAVELTETHGKFDGLAGEFVGADAEDILATEAFPHGRRLAIAAQDLALLEVDVNRVAPAAGVVLERPDLHLPDIGGSREPARVHVEGAVKALDRPGQFIGARGAAELKGAATGVLELLSREERLLEHHIPPRLVVFRIHGEVHLTGLHGPHLELKEAPHRGVAAHPTIGHAVAVRINGHALVALGEHCGQGDRILGATAAFVLEQVDHVQLLAGLELGEVHDDVKTLGNALHRQFTGIQTRRSIHVDRVGHDVAVVGHQVKGHAVIRNARTSRAGHFAAEALNLVYDSKLEIACHRAIQQAEAIATGAHLHERVIEPVRKNLVAEETVVLEGVQPELAVLVPGLAGDDHVDIKVAIAPVEARAAGQAQVDAIIQGLVAAVDGRVVVHHRGVALVDILRSEIEHVVVEPVGAHGFAEVARDVDDAAVAIGIAGARIGGACVDGVVARESHGPAIVVELAGEEEGVGVAIALGRCVAVVLVGREGVSPKTTVGRDVDGQTVVVAKEGRLSHAAH